MRLELGSIFHRARRLDASEARSAKRSTETQADAEVHVNLGFILSQMGDHAGSQKEFEAAIRLKPDLAEAHYYLGLGLMMAPKILPAQSNLSEKAADFNRTILTPVTPWRQRCSEEEVVKTF